jgi:outer membrane murein-binding lipoprotein Lpp
MQHPTTGHNPATGHIPGTGHNAPTGQPMPATGKLSSGARRKKPARPTTARKRRTNGPTRAYVAMWGTLAAVSMGYLAVLTVNPDMLTALVMPAAVSDPDSPPGQRMTAKLASDVQTLQQSVANLQGEVSALRTAAPLAIQAAVQGGGRSGDTLPEARQDLRQDPRVAGTKLQGRMAPLDGTRVAGMVIVTPGVNPGAPAAETDASQGRGARSVASIAMPGSSESASTPPPATTGPLGLELVTGPSVDALRLNWSFLGDRHGAALKSLEARYAASTQGGAFKLLAGPVASAEDGARLCEQFRAKGTPCRVGPFTGQGF